MKIGMCKSIGLGVSAVVLALGMVGTASAGAGDTFCGYQQVNGTQQWVKHYVGDRQCPSTDVRNGVQGYLIWEEYIA